jgi:hypothetical protein
MLSKQAVEEYQEIYKKEFHEEISFAEAEEQASRVLNLFKIIYKPIPKEWLDKDKAGK